jgi:exonuclease VII small subunit
MDDLLPLTPPHNPFVDLVERVEEAKEDLERALAAWERGDVRALLRYADQARRILEG